MTENKNNLYFAIINGEYKTPDFEAKDLFDAVKKAIDLYKKWKGQIEEVRGSDLSMRVWRVWLR